MKFFLSYCHVEKDDVQLARFLAEGLRQAGHEAFLDSGLPVGTDWVRAISDHIGSCHFLVALLSEEAIHSEMVQGEIRLAHQRRKREGEPTLLPIRIRYLGPLGYELDSYLGRTQYALWESPADSHEVLEQLLRPASQPASVAFESGTEKPAEELAYRTPEPDPRRPFPVVDPRAYSAPGGTLRIDDPFYLPRNADAVIAQRAALLGETIVIKAARQMGKSSLLLRYFDACKKAGKRIFFLDFSTFSDLEIADYPSLLTELASFLRPEGGIARIQKQQDLTHFVEDTVLAKIPEPVVLAFDEVDRIVGRPFQEDFFTMLRLWHNSRALAPASWGRVDLALVISTEPYLLIDAENRSPFNVTPAVTLDSFSVESCRDLNRRYGEPLGSNEVDSLCELLHGHPYLTRLAFYRLVAADRLGFSDLLRQAADAGGPFGDHLRALLMKLSRQTRLLDAMRLLVQEGQAPDKELADRLHGAGLIRRVGNRVVPANRVYTRFFESVL